MPLPLLAVAALAGGAGLLAGAGASKSNKRRPDAVEFQPYSGYRPPHVEGLRDVETMIRETLMRRSQGQDVGFDPARRDALLKAYTIQKDRTKERDSADIINALSGMGLSRNVKAREELLGRYLQDDRRDRDLYTANVDIEDLATQNLEKREATNALQNLNTFNFGQENNVADFDLDVYNAEQNNRYRSYGTEVERYNQYQDPIGTGIGVAGNVASSFIPAPTGPQGLMGSSMLPSSVKPSDALSGQTARSALSNGYNPYSRYSRYSFER